MLVAHATLALALGGALLGVRRSAEDLTEVFLPSWGLRSSFVGTLLFFAVSALSWFLIAACLNLTLLC